MKVSVIPGRELGHDVAAAWLALQRSNPDLASPYFHPEFTRTIACVRNNVEIAVIESQGKIEALFPFQRAADAVGSPVGECLSDFHGIVSAKEFHLSPTELLRNCGLIAWDFDHLLASQRSFTPFQKSLDPSPQIDISGGYSAYIKERRFDRFPKRIRDLEKRLGPIRFVAESRDSSLLQTVLAWKSTQYRRTGTLDLFATGWIRQTIEQIFTSRTDGCRGVLSLLYAGDRVIAGHFGMQSQLVWHYWFPSYDPEAAEYSPGLILLLKMVEHASSAGIPLIDLGKGLSSYKQRFMNSSSWLASGSVELPSWRRLRRRTWTGLRSSIAMSPAAPLGRVVLGWFRGKK